MMEPAAPLALPIVFGIEQVLIQMSGPPIVFGIEQVLIQMMEWFQIGIEDDFCFF